MGLSRGFKEGKEVVAVEQASIGNKLLPAGPFMASGVKGTNQTTTSSPHHHNQQQQHVQDHHHHHQPNQPHQIPYGMMQSPSSSSIPVGNFM